MKVRVLEDHINIIERNVCNTGELNIHPCQFLFDSCYDDLVKKALFTGEDGISYEMIISNNTCQIPSEVLTKEGNVILGVYAYQVVNNSLVLRYSPKESNFTVSIGSYRSNVENSSTPTPTELEQVEQAIENINNELDDIDGQLENIYTKDQVDDLIESTFTDAMGGEY